MLYRVHLAMKGFELTTLVMIATDCLGSCKCNYHTIIYLLCLIFDLPSPAFIEQEYQPDLFTYTEINTLFGF